MVFEDLHWADPGLLDFIDHLLEWSRACPIYVVTLARPELLDRRPDWGAGQAHLHLDLPGAARPSRRWSELLAGLVPGLPERPSARSSRGRTACRCMRWRPSGCCSRTAASARGRGLPARRRPVDLAVPETLTALIAARLDALDPADRALLQDAAVLGQSFSLAGPRGGLRAWPRRTSSRGCGRSCGGSC